MAILADGRITTQVQLEHAASGVSNTASVIVDTGAELSALPNHSLSTVLSHARLGPVVNFVVAGATISTMMASGLDTGIDAEPHGGGVASTATVSIGVPIHYLLAGVAPFLTFDGVLGMEMLDAFQADPVKDRFGSRSYLARRA